METTNSSGQPLPSNKVPLEFFVIILPALAAVALLFFFTRNKRR